MVTWLDCLSSHDRLDLDLEDSKPHPHHGNYRYEELVLHSTVTKDQLETTDNLTERKVANQDRNVMCSGRYLTRCRHPGLFSLSSGSNFRTGTSSIPLARCVSNGCVHTRIQRKNTSAVFARPIPSHKPQPATESSQQARPESTHFEISSATPARRHWELSNFHYSAASTQ